MEQIAETGLSQLICTYTLSSYHPPLQWSRTQCDWLKVCNHLLSKRSGCSKKASTHHVHKKPASQNLIASFSTITDGQQLWDALEMKPERHDWEGSDVLKGATANSWVEGRYREGNNPKEKYKGKKDREFICKWNQVGKSWSAWTLQDRACQGNDDDHSQKHTDQCDLREGWVSLISEGVTAASGRLHHAQLWRSLPLLVAPHSVGVSELHKTD